MNDPSHEPSLNVLLRLALAEKVATGLAAFVAGSILGLWLFPQLGAVAPSGWMLMRPVTAITILTIACSLAFSVPRRKPHANRISIVMAVAVLIFGVAVLLTYVSLVPYDPVSGFRRPAPQTAICIVIAGACIALGRPSKGWPATISDVTAVALVGFVLFLFGGVIFQVMAFVRYDTTTQTSPQTLFCFALFAFVMASRRASDGTLLAILVNQGIGSQMARVILPGILATPFLVFGAVAWLNESGLLAEAQTRAIIAPLLVLLAFAAMAMMARRANRLERQLRLQSLTDQLTGILNRRGFTVVSEYVMRNAERKEAGLTVFYFDLDGLKRSNDRLGA